MDLYVLRHAIAADSGANGRDSQRPLTDEGKSKLEKITRAWPALDVAVDEIITSPYVRARQTADIAAAALGAPIVELPALAAGADPIRAVEAIAPRVDAHSRVMIVGHEPDLGRLVTFLVTGDDRGGVRMKKASLVKLAVDRLRAGRCAVLEWSLWPRHMLALR